MKNHLIQMLKIARSIFKIYAIFCFILAIFSKNLESLVFWGIVYILYEIAEVKELIENNGNSD